MELRQLRYFVKVAETLNFSEAAKVLYITQSTLSQQIKQLEQELGCLLFERSSHNVSLTEAGAELLPQARNTIYNAEQCASVIQNIDTLKTGCLNIGVTYSFSPILTESILSFSRLYPKIRLNVFYKTAEELMAMLRDRTVDFVLAFRSIEHAEDVESHILFQNYLAAVVSTAHSLAAKDKITVTDLEKYDLALPAKGLQARKVFDAIVGGNASSLKVHIELNEVNILLKLLRQSSLVSILAEATTHNEAGVKAIPLSIPGNEMAGCVHILKGAYRKRAMQEFLKLLSESMAVRERQNAWI